MARLIQRLQRLEKQGSVRAIPPLTAEEIAFFDLCDDWIKNKVEPDLTTLTDWQRSFYAIALDIESRYR
jgi:hypothetical protein